MAKLSLGRESTSLKIHSSCNSDEYVYEAGLKRMRRHDRVPEAPFHAASANSFQGVFSTEVI